MLLLARDGKLSLDDPVRKYVPELPDYGTPITIRHMLQHTSGLRDWGNVEDIAGWPRGTRVYTHAHVLDILSRQKYLNFTPGTRWSYSNTGYNLAAIIVSRVSGISFAEFSRKRIFKPLGMTHTSWRDDYTRIVKGRAIAYAESDGRYHADMPFENVHGNGGLLTTVGDLLRWNENFVAPKVGDAAFVELMQTPGRLSSGETFDYAYGLGIAEYKGLREVSHSGTTASYRAFLARFPDSTSRSRFSAMQATARRARACTRWRISISEMRSRLSRRRHRCPSRQPTSMRLRGCTGISSGATYSTSSAPRARSVSEGGAPLIAQTSRRFTDGDGNVIEFDGNGHAFVDEGTGAPVRLERVTKADPTHAELAALAGDYSSDEAETTFTLRVRDGVLEATQRPDKVYRLMPLYADAFGSDLGTIIIRRDGDGHPNEFSVVEDRVWDLRFQRQDIPQDQAAVVARLTAQANQWDQAIVRKDRAAIEANMAEDFRQIDGSGNLETKTSFVEGIVSDQLEIDPYSVEEFDVRVFGDIALLSGRTRMTGRYAAKPFTSHYRYIDAYVRRNGEWKVVSVQITKIPEPR